MLENFQVGKATQERLTIERFLIGLQSESQGYMCLEKTLCCYINILGVGGLTLKVTSIPTLKKVIWHYGNRESFEESNTIYHQKVYIFNALG